MANIMGSIFGLIHIVRRSLQQHALSTLVTILSVALASGLVMSVFAIDQQTYEAFTSGGRGFDAILGARGSQLQLVLNGIFHLETSPGNIPWKLYTDIKNDPRISMAIPYAVGDNYKGYRIVGTTLEIFAVYEPVKGEHLKFDTGGPFEADHLQAVIGAQAAHQTGLKLGDEFNSYHGLFYGGENTMHPDRFKVVGVLSPTNGPMDRVIWIPIDSIYRMKGHELWGTGTKFIPTTGQAIPDEHKEVSAVMLRIRGAGSGFTLDTEINRRGTVATFAWPLGSIMSDLFSKLGWASSVLRLVAYLVVLVAAGSILVGIYNSMNERRRDFAILRALGARRRTIFAAVVAEAAVIGGVGAMAGFAVYAALLAAASILIRRQTGVVLNVWEMHFILWLAPLGMIVLGAVAGVFPAIRAYGTDVATNLTPVS